MWKGIELEVVLPFFFKTRMKTKVIWQDTMPECGDKRPPVWSIAFKPNGSEMVVGVGNRVLVYDALDGDLQHSLKGHKDTVYAVTYSADGKRFASGGADNTIIIWTSKAEGILKYSHNDSVQHLAYNPVTHSLASCTSSDFGLWSPEQKNVQKHKVLSKICCCAWTNDGQFLTLGHFNGTVSLRSKDGEEKICIERSGGAPIWCMQWKPPKEDQPYDILAVGCWDQTLSFWQISGAQHGKDRKLGFDPCSLGYCGDGEYIAIGGSDHKASLWTKEGVKLTTISEQKDWVWAVAPRPKHNDVAIGTNDGEIELVQMMFNTVHGLYKERYAYRDFMTDVIVQHLITEQKVRIKCRDYVKKIAVYKDRLAVQLPDRIVLYEVAGDVANNMHYKVKERINKRLDCNLLVMTSRHVILCHERKLQLYSFRGTKEREWVMESVIRYIKVIGGAPGREGVLIGLKNGAVFEVFINNPFPILLIRQNCSVRCLDLSMTRRKLAVVDNKNNCLVYDLKTSELLFKETNANSVSFNTEMEDMLCFSGNNMLSIKTGDYPVARQKMQGFVVGFTGSKIFCLHRISMQTIDVPQSASLYRFLEDKKYDQAYAVACLGVTESDWRLLATESLEKMRLGIARKAFIRVRDMRYIELLNHIEASKSGLRGDGKADDAVFLGRILSYQGRYNDAAKAFERSNNVDLAIEMYADLRNWDAAKAYAAKSKNINVTDLTRQQAEWSRDTADWKSAATMFSDSGDYERAIGLLIDHNGAEELVSLVRKLPNSEDGHLRRIAAFFQSNGHHKFAKETYVKLGAIGELMKLLMANGDWEAAMELAQNHPGQFNDNVFEPYAQYLAGEDRFEEAQAAYRRAGKPLMSIKLVASLAENAISEGRYTDAARHNFELAEEHLAVAQKAEDQADREMHIRKAKVADDHASMYHAYNFIWQYTEEPFTTLDAHTVFNASRYLLNVLGPLKKDPAGLSRVHILYALAQTSQQLEAFKLARWAYDRLQAYKIPFSWRDSVDIAIIHLQAKPYSDKEDLIPVCTRCYTSNALVNTANTGDICVQCGQQFQRCFLTFHPVPLVEFKLPEGMSREEGAKILEMDAPLEGDRAENASSILRKGDAMDDKIDQWRASVAAGTNPHGQGASGRSKQVEDEFGRRCLRFESGNYSPVEVDEGILRGIASEDIYVMECGGSQIPRYFRNMVGDGVDIVLNERRFFHGNDYEFCQLKGDHKPFVSNA